MAAPLLLRQVLGGTPKLFMPAGVRLRTYGELSDSEKAKVEFKDGKVCHDGRVHRAIVNGSHTSQSIIPWSCSCTSTRSDDSSCCVVCEAYAAQLVVAAAQREQAAQGRQNQREDAGRGRGRTARGRGAATAKNKTDILLPGGLDYNIGKGGAVSVADRSFAASPCTAQPSY
jgi:hypothetical protein